MGFTKYISTLLLLLAFGLQCFNNTYIVVDYYSNTKAYAKECINKNRPSMHCNGRCAMMKKLKSAEKKDAESPERKQDNKQPYFTLCILNSNLLLAISNINKKVYPALEENTTYKMPRSNFRPPGLV